MLYGGGSVVVSYAKDSPQTRAGRRELDRDWLTVRGEKCEVDGGTGRARSGHSL